MSAILVIAILVVVQAGLVLGAFLCSRRTEGRERSTASEVEQPADPMNFEESNETFVGYLIDGDPSVTLDYIFRE